MRPAAPVLPSPTAARCLGLLCALALGCSDDASVIRNDTGVVVGVDATPAGRDVDSQPLPDSGATVADSGEGTEDTGATGQDSGADLDAAASDAAPRDAEADAGFVADVGPPSDGGFFTPDGGGITPGDGGFGLPDFGVGIPDIGGLPDFGLGGLPDFGIGIPDFGIQFPDAGPLPDLSLPDAFLSLPDVGAACADLAVCCQAIPAPLQPNCNQVVNIGDNQICATLLLSFRSNNICP